MKNNKKFWILFAIIIALSVGTQLVAQDSTETKDCCVVPPIKNKKETTGKKVVKAIQDWDFRKYEAAHRRAHAKMDNNPQRYRRAQMVRQHRTKQWIKNLVIGGVAFYIGYEVGKDEMINKKKDKPMIWRDK